MSREEAREARAFEREHGVSGMWKGIDGSLRSR
jgi:hypothetical protein